MVTGTGLPFVSSEVETRSASASRLRSRRMDLGVTSSELPLPPQRVAVHHLDTLGRQLVADGVGGGEVLVRASGLAPFECGLDLGFGDCGAGRAQAQVGAGSGRAGPARVPRPSRRRVRGVGADRSSSPPALPRARSAPAGCPSRRRSPASKSLRRGSSVASSSPWIALSVQPPAGVSIGSSSPSFARSCSTAITIRLSRVSAASRPSQLNSSSLR